MPAQADLTYAKQARHARAASASPSKQTASHSSANEPARRGRHAAPANHTGETAAMRTPTSRGRHARPAAQGNGYSAPTPHAATPARPHSHASTQTQPPVRAHKADNPRNTHGAHGRHAAAPKNRAARIPFAAKAGIAGGAVVLAAALVAAPLLTQSPQPATSTAETHASVQSSTIAKTASATLTEDAKVKKLRKKTFFLTQSMHGRCTLASTAMMLRRVAYLDGKSNWKSIDEASVLPSGWLWGTGLRNSFEAFGYEVRCFSWKQGATAQSRTANLVRLLKKHPEGIVIYDAYVPHAILLTRYDEETGTFYCGDPAGGSYSGKEIKLADSWNGTVRGSQDAVICSLSKSWYVKRSQQA